MLISLFKKEKEKDVLAFHSPFSSQQVVNKVAIHEYLFHITLFYRQLSYKNYDNTL